MGWTYSEYLDQPLWFTNELIEQMNREGREMEKRARRMNNG